MATMLSQAVGIGIHLVSTVVLARMLAPDDYGVIAMVVAITSFAGLFRDLGLSAAAIQKGTLSQVQMSNLFWLNVGMGALLSSTMVISAPLIAQFYGKPELIAVTGLLSTTFLINSLGTQHSALMQRELRFGRKAIAVNVGALVAFGVTAVLAARGHAYWSLAWGQISGSLVTTLLLILLSPFRPGLWSRRAGMRSILAFGANVTAFDIVNYFHRNLDNILIGRFWGPDALGCYSRAYSLLMLPINNIRGPINAVGFPALSRLKHQPEAFRSYYKKIACILALTSMPITAFLFVAAEPVIEIALGPRWSGITPIFSILASVGFVQPVITLWGVVVLSRGMGRRYLHLGMFNTGASVVGFLSGIHWGAVGIATGYSLATYLTAYPILQWAFRGTPLRFNDFLSVTIRPFLASITSVVLCLGLMSTWPSESPWFSIMSCAALFVPAYILSVLCLPGGRADLAMVANLLKPLSSRLLSPKQSSPR